VIGLGLLLGPGPNDRQLADERRLQTLESMVEKTRQQTEDAAKALWPQVERVQQLDAEIRANPNDLALRDKKNAADEALRRAAGRYRGARSQWQEKVSALERKADELAVASAVLDANRELPRQFDFADEILNPVGEAFPFQEASSKFSRLQVLERQFAKSAERPADNEAILMQLAKQIDVLRGELNPIRHKWRFEPDELKGPSAVERLKGLGIDPSPRHVGPQIPRTVTDNDTLLLLAFNSDSSPIRGQASVTLENGRRSLITDAMQENVLVHLPVELPPWYEIEADVTRLDGTGAFFFVLPIDGDPGALVIDGAEDLGYRTGLVLDNQLLSSPRYRDKFLAGQQLPLGKTVPLKCTVREGKLQLFVDNELRYAWEGRSYRLSLPPFYRGGRPNDLCTGSFHSRYRVAELVARRLP
jgi:hypothetical protein